MGHSSAGSPMRHRIPRVRTLAVALGAVAVFGISGAAWLGSTAHAVSGTAVPAAALPASAMVATPVSVNSASTTAAQPVSADTRGTQMQDAVEAAVPGSRVGVDVVDTSTGTTVASINADQQFYTASVVKVLIALDAMKSEGWQPDSDTSAQLTQMLSASDDDIADQLWDANGGPQIVTRMAATIGLSDTQPPDDPEQWGETRTTPADVVMTYHYLTAEVPQPARDVVLGALHAADATAADGTDQYFGIPDALPGTDWAIKQGWMTLDDSTTLDTTGLVSADPAQPDRYVVVVLSTQPAGTEWSTGGAALTAAVATVRDTLVPTSAVGAAPAETVTCSSQCAAGDR